MRKTLITVCVLLQVAVGGTTSFCATTIPANDPNIQYFGRWDFSDPTAPAHSWPGVYIYAKFQGTSIGVRMADNFCYYNVFIDGTLDTIFHPTNFNLASYTLVSGLPDGEHTILLTKRNESNWTKFSFNGFILDSGKTLLPPPAKPSKRIEFIGDSFTASSGNEFTGSGTSTSEYYTNAYKGFPSIVARNYGADYQITAFSGWGLVVDYLGKAADNIPDIFNRTLGYTRLPVWDFSQYIPNLVVICLGLNDNNGWGGFSDPISAANRNLWESRYHDFIAWIRDVYPGVKILLVGAQVDWIQTGCAEVTAQERADGHNDIFSTSFPRYPDTSYVNNGHPNVTTHQKIADIIIATIDTINAWQTEPDTVAPSFVHLPSSPFTVTDTSFGLTLQTDENANVRYSTQDKAYSAMDSTFTTTGRRTHSVILKCRPGQSYTYYARAIDDSNNAMGSSAVIQFNVDTSKGQIDWRSPAFDDASWSTGYAPLGVGSIGLLNTTFSRVATAYFRKKVTIPDISSIGALKLSVICNDGAVVYVNGHEAGRINMPAGSPVPYQTYAMTAASINGPLLWTALSGQLAKWKSGENLLAVEIHGSNGGSRVSFDAQLQDTINTTFFPLRDSWTYYAQGDMPQFQAGSKLDGVSPAKMLPVAFALEQNYPNPFNPGTTLSYQLSAVSRVKLVVYDLLGRQVSTLVDGLDQAGEHRVTWDAARFATGTYFARLTAQTRDGKFWNKTVKMLLLK